MICLLGAACRLTQLREHLADGILPNWRKERMIFNKSLQLPTFLVGLEEFLIGVVQIELGLIRRAPHWEKKPLALLLVCISWQEVVGLLCSALQAEQVVDVAHCSWLDLVVMPIFAATLADQHLLHTAPQLLMVREETTVQDVHLVAVLHLHPDPALVGCQCILFEHQNIPVLVLHAQLEEEPGTEHVKTGFTLQNGALRFDYYLAPSVPPPQKK